MSEEIEFDVEIPIHVDVAKFSSDMVRIAREAEKAAQAVEKAQAASSAKAHASAQAASERAMGAWKNAAMGIGHSMMGAADMVSGVIDTMGRVVIGGGLGLATAAGGAAMHQIHKGLTTVNATMEESKIGFASLFNMFGAAPDITAGMKMSGKIIEGIRKDAAALPGEFQDFVSMAQVLTGPVLKAGRGMEDLRNMTKDTVVAAATLKIPFEVASREMAMMLAGNVSSHMPLASKLGINHNTKLASGKDWSHGTEKERYDYMEKALVKAKDALPLFMQSWTGLTSNIQDNWKNVLGRMTEPLFNRIKTSMAKGLQWSSDNQGKIDAAADRMGASLGNAFLRFEPYMERIPDYFSRAMSHSQEIVNHAKAFANVFGQAWDRILPIAQHVGELIGKGLQDPAHLLKQLVAFRLATGAAHMLPGAMQAAGGAAQLAKGLGMVPAGGIAAMGGATAMAAGGIGLGAVAVLDNVAGSAERFWNMIRKIGEGFASVVPLFEKGGLLRDILGVTGAFIIGIVSLQVGFMSELGKMIVEVFDALDTAWRKVKGMLSSGKEDLGAAGRNILHPENSAGWDPYLHMGNSRLGANEGTGTPRNTLFTDSELKAKIANTTATEDATSMVNRATSVVSGNAKANGEATTALSGMTAGTVAASAGADTLSGAMWGLAGSLAGPLGTIGGFMYGAIKGEVGPGFVPKDDAVLDHHTDTPTLLTRSVPLEYVAGPKKKDEPVKVDARGSKIEIKLDAKGDSPDRIARRIMDAFGRAVARPMTSSYGPAKGY